jgi:acyl-coenzyme A thioesterase PaaI-like protein
MSLQFLAAIRGEDAIAEGWVEKRGRSTCFCRVEVRTASGDLAATASVVYKVGAPIDTPRP